MSQTDSLEIRIAPQQLNRDGPVVLRRECSPFDTARAKAFVVHSFLAQLQHSQNMGFSGKGLGVARHHKFCDVLVQLQSVGSIYNRKG